MQLIEIAPHDIIPCVLVELIGRARVLMDDVQDNALAIGIGTGMSGEIQTAVRFLLVEAPAVTGRVQ